LLPSEARYPEGIAAENKRGTFYVSSFFDCSIYRGNVRREKVKLFDPIEVCVTAFTSGG
jgi:hypothetical protein